MSKVVIVTLSIVVVFSNWCPLFADNPGNKEVLVEDRPLRDWLQDQYKISTEGGDKAKAVLKRSCADIKTAIPALAGALEDKEELVRFGAADCLHYYCDGDVQAVLPLLLKALREDKSGHVRARVMAALSDTSRQDRAVLAAFLKTLKEDKDGEARLETVCQLGAVMGKEAKATVLPAVIDALRDHHSGVRLQAVYAVARLAERKTSIPLVINALGDKDGYVSEAASRAIGDLFPEALPPLHKALENRNPAVRAAAVYAFELAREKDEAGPLVVKEVPTIIALLKDKDRHVRAAAARALGMLKAADAVQDLIAKVDDTDAEVRGWCIYALGKIGPDAAVATEKLINYLNDPDPGMRGTTACALGRIGPKAKAAVPALVPLLKDKSADVRLQAILALGEIGPAAKAAVPSLKETMKDDDGVFMDRIEEVLKKIGDSPVDPNK